MLHSEGCVITVVGLAGSLFRLAEKSDGHRTECDKETNSSDVTSEYRVSLLRGSLFKTPKTKKP